MLHYLKMNFVVDGGFMKISEAFGLGSGEVVTLVGGGGKTTFMFRLASEFSEKGKFVVTTTTTKIYESEGRKADRLRYFEGLESLREELKDLAGKAEVLTLASEIVEGEKLSGPKPEVIDKISSFGMVDLIIVEGDGAAHKSFKAPAAYEPVVPKSTSLAIPILGVDVVGRPITSRHVHRPGRICDLTNAEKGDQVTPRIVAQVISSARGGLKGIPTAARVIPLINKVVTEEDKDYAEEIAELILSRSQGRIEKVAFGEVRAEDPISGVITGRKEKE